MATYSANVERWRPLLEKYFRPEDIDKALYVIQWESSGNPEAQSDSGGYGLFQLNDGGLGEGLTIPQRLDPETNVRTAAAAVYGGSGWAPWGEGSEQYSYPYDPNTGKGRFGSLGDRPYPGGTGVASGDVGGVSTPDEFKLPFTEEEYRQKYARSQEILSQIWDPDLKAIRPDADQALVNEYLGLDSELKSYDDVIARGGHDFSDYMNWVNYQNQSRQIDATNAANQAARQLQINSAAEDATMKELQEQRARADSAIQDQALFRKASHFDSPMGFRVGQENPMPEDQVFAKKVSEISDKVGPYVPIPQNIDIGPFSSYRTKAPIATKADTSLDPQKGPADFYPGWETNGTASQVPSTGGTWNPLAIAQQGANVFGQQGFKPSQLTYQPWNQKPFNAVQTPSPTAIQNFSNAVQQRSPFTLAGAGAPSSRPQGSAFAETARGAARKIVGSLLFGGSR